MRRRDFIMLLSTFFVGLVYWTIESSNEVKNDLQDRTIEIIDRGKLILLIEQDAKSRHDMSQYEVNLRYDQEIKGRIEARIMKKKG